MSYPFSQKLRWMYFQVDAGWINHLQELAKPETSWKKQRAKQQKTHPHQRFLIAARISFVSLVAVQQLWHLKRSGPALRHHIQTHNSGSIKSKCTAALHPPHPVMWHEVGVHIVKQCDFPPARLHNVAHGISKKQQRVVTPIQWQMFCTFETAAAGEEPPATNEAAISSDAVWSWINGVDISTANRDLTIVGISSELFGWID